MVEVVAALRSIIGARVAAAGLGGGSALKFRLDAPDDPRSVLVICPWRLESAAAVLLGSDDDLTQIAETLPRMDGLAVVDIAHDDVTNDLTMDFDGGTRLRSFVTSRDDGEDQWMVFVADGLVVSCEVGRPIAVLRADGGAGDE